MNRKDEMAKQVKHLIFRICKLCPPLMITLFGLFGYRSYQSVKRKVGDKLILACAKESTGDIYFCGMYLAEWLKGCCDRNTKQMGVGNGSNDFIFLYGASSQKKVANLFPILRNHMYDVTTKTYLFWEGICRLQTCAFIDYKNFFFAVPLMGLFKLKDGLTGHKASKLQGYRNLTMLDGYLWEMGLTRDTKPKMPEFTKSEWNPKPNTIVISPYALSFCEYLLDNKFWTVIVNVLNERGYYLLTNCASNEIPLPNTKPLFLPYNVCVPYLNQCSGFIGFRSGLCDIVSTAICKKVILYSYEAMFHPDGRNLAFTGLKNMGLCSNAVEIEMMKENRNMKQVIDRVLAEFPEREEKRYVKKIISFDSTLQGADKSNTK